MVGGGCTSLARGELRARGLLCSFISWHTGGKRCEEEGRRDNLQTCFLCQHGSFRPYVASELLRCEDGGENLNSLEFLFLFTQGIINLRCPAHIWREHYDMLWYLNILMKPWLHSRQWPHDPGCILLLHLWGPCPRLLQASGRPPSCHNSLDWT